MKTREHVIFTLHFRQLPDEKLFKEEKKTIVTFCKTTFIHIITSLFLYTHVTNGTVGIFFYEGTAVE